MFCAARDALLHFKKLKLDDDVRQDFSRVQDEIGRKQPDRIFLASIKYLLDFLASEEVTSSLRVFPKNTGMGNEVFTPSPIPGFPALIITFSSSYGHVWFSANLDEYKRSYLKQMPPDSMLYAIASLKG
jgi:hypothetical protein